MKQTITILIIVAIIVLGFVLFRGTESPNTDGTNTMRYEGTLEDITGGTASGTVAYEFENKTFFLEATFQDLPDPGNGWYYEGWVVRSEPFEFISVGRAAQHGGVRAYELSYQGDEDLTEYTFFTLTHEFDDINPGPAKHILEGTLFPIGQ